MITDDVATAIEELRQAFPAAEVTSAEDGSGGAYVTVDPVPLGAPWVQADTWVKFHITFQYPASDVYPHFVRPDMARADGGAIGEAMSQASFHGIPAIQISRLSKRLDPEVDTAALKLVKVLHWLDAR